MSTDTASGASAKSPRSDPRKRSGNITATSEQSRRAVLEAGHATVTNHPRSCPIGGHSMHRAASVELSTSLEANIRAISDTAYSAMTRRTPRISRVHEQSVALSYPPLWVCPRKVHGRGKGPCTVHTRAGISRGRGQSAGRPPSWSVHDHDPATTRQPASSGT